MNTIFITYFVSVTFVKCCIQIKGYIQYCLYGFFWACRSWPSPGTTIPTWECEWDMLLFSLNQIYKPTSIQLKETPHVPMGRHSKLPTANVAVGHDGVTHGLMKAIGKNFLLCFFPFSFFSLNFFSIVLSKCLSEQIYTWTTD